MLKREQEEALLQKLKDQEAKLHESLVASTHELRIARQEVAAI